MRPAFPRRVGEWTGGEEEREETWRINDEFGWVCADGEGERRVIVPRAVSEAYGAALALMDRNPEAMAALPGFLAFLNAPAAEELPGTPADMVFPVCFGEEEAGRFRENLEDWGRMGTTREEAAAALAEYAYEAGPWFAAGEIEGRFGVMLATVPRPGTEADLHGAGGMEPWPYVFDDGRWKEVAMPTE